VRTDFEDDREHHRSIHQVPRSEWGLELSSASHAGASDSARLVRSVAIASETGDRTLGEAHPFVLPARQRTVIVALVDDRPEAAPLRAALSEAFSQSLEASAVKQDTARAAGALPRDGIGANFNGHATRAFFADARG
jgi:hypothetical protein